MSGPARGLSKESRGHYPLRTRTMYGHRSPSFLFEIYFRNPRNSNHSKNQKVKREKSLEEWNRKNVLEESGQAKILHKKDTHV